MIRDLLFANGAKELSAVVVDQNRPIRSFLESVGFVEEDCNLSQKDSAGQFDTDSANLSAERNQRQFVRYVIKVDSPIGPFRQETDLNPK